MITLHTFGPAFGLPDPSPFVLKAETLLKLSGLPYRTVRGNMRKAPKGKLPFIDDDGECVPDSTFIRLHLAQKHGITLDEGLSEAQKATAWAVDCLCGDHLYWLVVQERWLDDTTFERGPARFFQPVPAPLRGLVKAMVRRGVRKTLHGQGLGRFSAEERQRLLEMDLDALAGLLGNQDYLFGQRACWADASMFAFLAGGLTRALGETPSIRAIRARPTLMAYVSRMREAWYPEWQPS